MSEASQTIRRDGRDLSVIEELASDTLGALEIEPRWFGCAGWHAEGDMATATVYAYEEDGAVSPVQYRLTMSVERLDDVARRMDGLLGGTESV